MRRREGLSGITSDDAPTSTHTRRVNCSPKPSMAKQLLASLAATPCRLAAAIVSFVVLVTVLLGVLSNTDRREALLRQSTTAATAMGRDLSELNGLIIRTHLGDIRIHFTPEYSGKASIQYIVDVVQAVEKTRNNVCQNCTFYRVEKTQLLEGILTDALVPENKVLGPCPDPNYIPPQHCKKNDPCRCHGPIMTKGMVAWSHHVGDGGGPDFVINTIEKPVEYWGGHHTVWGEIRDAPSLKVVASAEQLPIDIPRTRQMGMVMLKEALEFSLELF